MDPLLLALLALFTAFVLGRASTRATWRRIHTERLYLAGFQAVAEQWRQLYAPVVADWPTALPEGEGVRQLTTRAAAAEPTAEDTGPLCWPVAVGRHRRRHDWTRFWEFWSATSTPRDPQARIAAAMARAEPVGKRWVRPPMRYAEITDPVPVRELVGVF